ncbi:MAG: asparaginase, partial [Planctomycetota bacterium]|nr:asparaginase [Planctomycetota bacterium]
QQVRRFLGDDWSPLRIARDGCGLPTLSNTVNELAVLYAGLTATRDEDWIWQSMIENPDLVGGFNRLDSTTIKACDGKVLCKEGADGLVGLAINHPDYPNGLGVVIKVAHGWNSQASWYVARGILGSLGFDLRNPYSLHRQKAFLVPGIVPESRMQQLESVLTWDDWDPDKDRYEYDYTDYCHDD